MADKSQEMATKKVEVIYDTKGCVVGNKNKLMERSLQLLKVSVSVAYDKWEDVQSARKDDIWDTLSKEFDIPFTRKDTVLSMLADQLTTWKRNLRQKYFKGLDGVGISKLKDIPPKKEQIAAPAWRAFVERESSEAKLKQRAQNSKNRGMKSDVHCLGRTSYAEVAHQWLEDGKEFERCDLYLHGRKQQKLGGATHPSAVDTCAKIIEVKSTQPKGASRCLKNDVLSQCRGPDRNGRTVAVSSKVSARKLKDIAPLEAIISEAKKDKFDLHSKMDKLVDKVGDLTEQFAHYKDSLTRPTISTSVGAHSSSGTPQLSPASAHESPLLASGSSGRNSTSSGILNDTYILNDVFNQREIALGQMSSSSSIGVVVHGRQLSEHERRVIILQIMDGMEDEVLYLRSQGGATSIGDIGVGGYVIWPIHLMQKSRSDS